MRDVAIRLDEETSAGAGLWIWNQTVLERLLRLCRDSGVAVRTGAHSPGDLPAHLVCSTRFFKAYLESGQSFDPFACSTRFAFDLCSDPGSVRRAKRRLFADAKKPTDGWVSRNLNAKLSIPLSRILAELPLHPNGITFLNVPLGIAAAWHAARPGYGAAATAGLLFQFASVFDGCDGEIARTKLQVTKLGGWLDTMVDNLAYLLFFLGVGIWQAQQKDQGVYLHAMGVALMFLAGSLILTYVGMKRMGTESHHEYRQALDRLFRDRAPLRLFHRISFLSKRENFALGICLLCLLNLREVVYWGVLVGLGLYSAVVCSSFPALIERLGRGRER
ncbi:MAG: CDP-alcohol phosphatidyltransferase family protein [Nitrospirae bacterium]|nr:CDP-alcohol phosphatidyltransferase family protein [Nitrospirota bacterium]